MALTNKLTAIADAIREKTGTTEPMTLDSMATAISGITGGGGGELSDYIPESALTLTGNCNYRFSYGGWDWFIEKYGDRITTNNISSVRGMFTGTSLKEIPFEINIGNALYFESMFDEAEYIEELPIINIPEVPNWQTVSYSSFSKLFSNMKNLKRIREENLPFLRSLFRSNGMQMNQMFYSDTALDELTDLPVGLSTSVITSNMFSLAFHYCRRLKNVIFTTDNGTPYVRQWKNQTIDLSYNIGYGLMLIDLPSGITADKQVTDDATYQSLKDDPDWFTADIAYSRYNHDSAVRTINSLPDTSEYLASAGGTNTIKFDRVSGLSTDGGAINSLTEEEIAVATAKGWTVTLSGTMPNMPGGSVGGEPSA